LTALGYLKKGYCKQTGQTQDQAIFRSSGSNMSDEGILCIVDYPDEPVSKGCFCLRIANWSSDDVNTTARRRFSMGRASYLILEKVDSDIHPPGGARSTLRRIGMGLDSVPKVDKLFNNAERRKIRLI
jgi:hypothetical protein